MMSEIYTIALFVFLPIVLIVGVVLCIILASRQQLHDDNDTRGTPVNPPVFIDVLSKKTLNMKIDERYDIKIPHLPFLETIYGMQAIQASYMALKKACGDGVITVDDKTLPMFLLFAETLTNYLFSISTKFVKGSNKKYKRAIRNKVITDIEWTNNITTEIFDFWAYTKKKVELLASGTTLRQMYGEDATSACLKTGWDGEIYLLPRFGNVSNTTQNSESKHTYQNKN